MSDELEDSDRSRIRQLIQDVVQQPMLAEVTEVFARDKETAIVNDDNATLFPSEPDPVIRPSNHEVSVEAPPGIGDQTYDRRPVMTPTSGVVAPPQVDDLVLLVFPSRSDLPFVIGNLYGDSSQTRAPIGDPGVIRFRRGGLYVELLGDGSEARIAKKSNDSAISPDAESPDAEVAVTDSGDINITNSGGSDIQIDAGGGGVEITGGSVLISNASVSISGSSVQIDEGGIPDSVLTKDAKFEYEQREDTKDGTGGTVTKETSTVSNGATTETDIQ
jgi:hypothetical protein